MHESNEFQFCRTGISHTTRSVQPDLLLILPSGNRIPIQACYRNKPENEADALLKLHELAELGPEDPDKVDFVMVVAVNKNHKNKIDTALKKKNSGRISEHIVLLDFDTILKPTFDWAEIIERSP